jgi:hypothetical protein
MDEAKFEQTVDRIRGVATQVIEELAPLSKVEFGLNRASVKWVEGFIERERKRRDPADGVPEGLVDALGAFLGECIAVATGGKWVWSEQQWDWGIHFDSGMEAFPFHKVRKQFKDGLQGGESILSFYDISVNYVATGKLRDLAERSRDEH